MEINGHDVSYAAGHSVAACKNSTVHGAGTDSDHPFRIGGRVIGAQQRLAHILGYGAGYHQHIGMAWRSNKAQAKALEIVKRIIERMDFQLATIAGTGIDLANGQRTTKPGASGAVDWIRIVGRIAKRAKG